MSIIAGIYKRKKGVDAGGQIFNELKSLISRRENDSLLEFENDRIGFAKLDVKAFETDGFLRDSGQPIAMLGGEPLFDTLDISDRNSELDELCKSLTNGTFQNLKKVQGVFCAAVLADEKLHLISDKIGLRPLYYWFDEEKFIFSSALRILENLSVIPKSLDLQGMMELTALGYPLGDRTAFQNISTINAAEIITVDEFEVCKQTYWHWDQIKVSDESEEKLLARLYENFNRATARRLRFDRTTAAYLSGGLDSRCVVAALKNLNVRIHTFNFARPETQDLIFGRWFAEAAGVLHNEIPKESGDQIPDYSTKMALALEHSASFRAHCAERPQVVWSGEGGSVALGHVHIGSRIVELMRKGQLNDAVSHYIERESLYLTQNMLNASLSKKIYADVFESVCDEIRKFNSTDAGRNFFLYLLLNDQRRKLAKHFENIDLHRLEFQLPFFDSRFIETILSVPLELCLEHKFYVKWLYLFPKEVTSVPWQAYPGHEPCPIPITERFSYQWDETYQTSEQLALNRKLLADTKESLRSPNFPHFILNKNKIRTAYFIHRTGLRDYTHIFETARIYMNYWEKCSGQKIRERTIV